MTSSAGVSGSSPGTPWGPLADDLVALAQVAEDDAVVVDALLARIAVGAAEVVAGVDFASITAWRGAGYVTVAASSDLVRAVDDAQYAERAGPCVQAGQTAVPVAVPDIPAMTMSWPGFREQASRLGLRASVSVPLFAGGGAAVAVLNLYGRESAVLLGLATGVSDVFAAERIPAGGVAADGDAGAVQFLHGLGEALQLRVTIQRAVGMLMAEAGCDAAQAHRLLRVRAAEADASLSTAALLVIDEMVPHAGAGLGVTVGPSRGDVVSVVVSGELAVPVDAAVAGRLAAVFGGPARVVELDLSGLGFCDVAGLRILRELRERAVAGGRQVRLVAASPAVHTLLRLTETAAVFGYSPAPESAGDGEPAG